MCIKADCILDFKFNIGYTIYVAFNRESNGVYRFCISYTVKEIR